MYNLNRLLYLDYPLYYPLCYPLDDCLLYYRDINDLLHQLLDYHFHNYLVNHWNLDYVIHYPLYLLNLYDLDRHFIDYLNSFTVIYSL